MIDVRGKGLRQDHKARVLRGKNAAQGVRVVGQRYVSPTHVQVMLKLEPNAQSGNYSLIMMDALGQVTNPRNVEVMK